MPIRYNWPGSGNDLIYVYIDRVREGKGSNKIIVNR